MDWLDTIEAHWVWLAIGLILGSAEMLVPGVFLIWLAGAAIITGLVAWMLPVGLPVQIVLFAVLSMASVFIGRRYLRDNPIHDADPLMNRRGARLVGDTATVTVAIDGGTGRIRHGDSEWLAKGEDAVPGERVRIIGSDGSILLVERVSAP